MSKLSVYDENVLVDILRDGQRKTVPFCQIKDGDRLADTPDCIVSGDAHFSGDETYDGWLFFDKDGNDYYPEDFGADLIYNPFEEPDQDEEEEDK